LQADGLFNRDFIKRKNIGIAMRNPLKGFKQPLATAL